VFLAWRALRGPLAEANPWAGRFAGVVAIAAAVYQVTPLKSLCLRQCRSPMSFFLRHGKHLDRPSGAVRAGVRHGLYCLGCCWLLMAILIAFGTMRLGVMVALAALILLEKDAPFGERLAHAAAAAFLVLGVALVLHPSFINHIA
jgi:predicted metal-binding membrane protein